jgi:hypothetical protein
VAARPSCAPPPRRLQDYLVAEGNSTSVVKDKQVAHSAKYYISQDGAQ